MCSKRCVRSSARYGRFLKETKRGLAIDRQAIAELERFDGKFVVHSNDDTLTAEDMALGYSVEEAWRTMQGACACLRCSTGRRTATMLTSRSRCWPCYWSVWVCQDTWRNIRDDLKRIQLAQSSIPNGTVWQVTEPTTEAANRLKALKIKPRPAILKLG